MKTVDITRFRPTTTLKDKKENQKSRCVVDYKYLTSKYKKDSHFNQIKNFLKQECFKTRLQKKSIK